VSQSKNSQLNILKNMHTMEVTDNKQAWFDVSF